jgi:hypothetical protein
MNPAALYFGLCFFVFGTFSGWVIAPIPGAYLVRTLQLRLSGPRLPHSLHAMGRWQRATGSSRVTPHSEQM